MAIMSLGSYLCHVSFVAVLTVTHSNPSQVIQMHHLTESSQKSWKEEQGLRLYLAVGSG